MAAKPIRQARFVRPDGATEILLIRHGESAPSVDGQPFVLKDGHGDPALATIGEEQAEQVAERLAGEPISAIYVTTLQRTHQTAAPLAARLSLTPGIVPELREIFLGDWEGGLIRKMAAQNHPIYQQVVKQQTWDVIPNAEKTTDFRARVMAGLTQVVSAHPDELVAVVVHGGVVNAIMSVITGTPNGFVFMATDNASITHIVSTEDRWIVRGYNDIAHLERGFRSPQAQPE